MLEDSRSNTLEDIESTIDTLRADIEERRAWLSTLLITECKPEFLHKYTRRSAETFRNADARVDKRMDNMEDKQELTQVAKREIQALKRELNAAIAVTIYDLNAKLEEQFDTNEDFMKMDAEDRAAVLEDHKRECINTERRMRTLMGRRIDMVNYAPTSRIKHRMNKDSWTDIIRERRDREEIRFCIQMISEEKRLLAQFEEYVATIKPEDGITSADILDFREEHIQTVAVTIDDQKKIFYDDRARRDRMARARYLQMTESDEDPDEKEQLMQYYTLKMEECGSQSESTTEWYRALRELDSIFVENSENWNQFIDIVVYYWRCLSRPRRRAKWDRIISRYATLFLEKSSIIPLEDVPYNTSLRTLRNERDKLLSEVMELDEEVRSRCSKNRKMKKEVVRGRTIKKQMPSFDYTVKLEATKKSTSSRAVIMNWNEETRDEGQVVGRRDRKLALCRQIHAANK